VKKGIVIAAILILVILSTALAQELVNGSIVVVGTNTPADQQGVCTPQNNIITSAYGRAKSLGSWIITRDYRSAASNAWRWLLSLSLGLKIIIVLAILLVIFLIWNYNFRDTRVNNMKKARIHHLRGEEAHRRGDEEKAREHYEKARGYREKGQDQW
jgi:hypothetical protein